MLSILLIALLGLHNSFVYLLVTAMADVDEMATISRDYVANIATGVTKPDAYICLVHSFFFIKSQVWV